MREERRLSVCENIVLRRIFVSNKEQWSKLNSEELGDLYISPNIFLVIKTRRKNWEGHVHFWGEERCIQGFGGEF